MQKYNYKDMLELGFERVESQDSDYIDVFGHHLIYLVFEINQFLTMHWDCFDRTIQLHTIKEGDTILKTTKITIEHAMDLLDHQRYIKSLSRIS